jgi:hypothetical protein
LQSTQALGSEEAVGVRGEVVSKIGKSTVTVTVQAISSGATTNSEGTLDLEGPSLGFNGLVKYVIVGSTTYVYGGTAFWTSLFISGHPTAAAEKLKSELMPQVLNRWIKLPVASTGAFYKDSLGLAEPRTFVSGSLAQMKGTLTNTGGQTLDGAHGVQIDSSTGAKVLVAATGSPIPLALAGAQSASSGTFTVTIAVDYPTPTTIAAPPGAESLATLEVPYEK